MSSTAGTDEVVEVSDDGVTVRKTFAADQFPVPAICFEIESEHDVPVTVRLSEDIPESFPMDGVGFHPDYHNDSWTAFKDNHVEFARTLEPGETLLTVYGIRIDDESVVSDFLTPPTIVDVSTDGESESEASTETDAQSDAEAIENSTIQDILSDDRNQVVKDMLAGDADTIPGLEADDDSSGDSFLDDGPEIDLDLGDVDGVDVGSTADDPTDDVPDIDLGFGDEDILEPGDESDIEFDLDDEGGNESDDDGPTIELDIEAAKQAAEEATKQAGANVGSGTTGAGSTGDSSLSSRSGSPTSAETGSVSARLAAELREGTVDEDDLAVLQNALANLGRLQSRVDDLESDLADVREDVTTIQQWRNELGSTFSK